MKSGKETKAATLIVDVVVWKKVERMARENNVSSKMMAAFLLSKRLNQPGGKHARLGM